MDDVDLEEIAGRHGLVLIVQFGSSVAGPTHPRSDIDIGVLLDRARLGPGEFAELVHDLQRLSPDREVDLAILNHADPLFLKKITETCRLLYGSPRRLQRLKLYAFKRYQDHRKYLDMERRFVTRALQELGHGG